MVWSHASTDIDRARLLAASSPHSGDWLAAPPITSVWLRLSDEEIRIAVAHRLGCRACEPHTCVCGKAVDGRGLHGLACKRSAPRQQHHSHLNIIWRAMKRAQIPAVKEPVGLMRQDGKRPDGTTILPWSRDRPLAWDVTVPDTYADAHVVNTAREAGAAANHAATNKNTKYSQLSSTHVFVPVAIETGVHGTIRRWNWYRRLEDGRPILQAMPGSPTSCSSSCPWHYRGGMRSHFKTRSPPASSLQSVVSFY